jgi:HD superfamily phosphodiesterase
MKIMNLSPILNYAFNYVAKFSKIYNIDESHALKHSMEVYRYAKKIYESELNSNPLIYSLLI